MSNPTPTNNSSPKSFSEDLETTQGTFASSRLGKSSAATEEETPTCPSTPHSTPIQSHHFNTNHSMPQRTPFGSIGQRIQDQVFLSDQGRVVQQSRTRDMTERDGEPEIKEEYFEKEFERISEEAKRDREAESKEEKFEKEDEEILEKGKRRFEELRKAGGED
ncbi:hypothetical protein EYC80_006568 [Monilinia laxa]|uniref:Uncharacterized protein n=1 Tax=Monilinia laxa TaxID=61186 RepID=A0A5N6JSB9_MONLA|nr:hypothetical protein EYC80_006568 [Monilinia laxa]